MSSESGEPEYLFYHDSGGFDMYQIEDNCSPTLTLNLWRFHADIVVSKEPGHAIGFKAGQSADGGLGLEEEVSPTLSATPSALEPTVCVKEGSGVKCLNPRDPQTERIYSVDGAHPALSANSGGGQDRHGICYSDKPQPEMPKWFITIIRRMTPLECMRLQGFPDFYLLAPTSKWRKIGKYEYAYFVENGFGKYCRKTEKKGESVFRSCLAVDSVMYKAAGNSWQVNVPRWILKRMEEWDKANPESQFC